MLNREPKPPTDLELALKRALTQLDGQEVGSKEYGEILDRVVKLHKMKEEEKSSSVSMDTKVRVGANLLGILLIISHERVHLINTQAMKLVGRSD
jgi:hypothetical protein